MCAEYVWAKMAGVACLSAAFTQSITYNDNLSNHISAHAKIYGMLCKWLKAYTSILIIAQFLLYPSYFEEVLKTKYMFKLNNH